MIPFFHVHPRSKPSDGPVSRHINRWLAAPVTWLVLRTNLTPNQISVCIGSLAVPMVVVGLLGHIVAAAGLLQAASILDEVDGEIARAKNQESRFGALLDTVLDYGLDAVGLVSIGLALLFQSEVSATVVVATVGVSVGVRLIDQYVVKMVPDPSAHLLRDTRDTVNLAILIAALLTWPLGPWIMIGTLAFINLWRIDNTLYRLGRFRNLERSRQQH